jgi:hypothetical protein
MFINPETLIAPPIVLQYEGRNLCPSSQDELKMPVTQFSYTRGNSHVGFNIQFLTIQSERRECRFHCNAHNVAVSTRPYDIKARLPGHQTYINESNSQKQYSYT